MNIARDCAVEVQVAREDSCVARRERGIDIEAVPGKIIVFLGDVDLRVRREERRSNKRIMISDEEKIRVFMDRRLRSRLPSKTAHCTPVKDYRNQSEQKSNATVSFRRFD